MNILLNWRKQFFELTTLAISRWCCKFICSIFSFHFSSCSSNFDCRTPSRKLFCEMYGILNNWQKLLLVILKDKRNFNVNSKMKKIEANLVLDSRSWDNNQLPGSILPTLDLQHLWWQHITCDDSVMTTHHLWCQHPTCDDNTSPVMTTHHLWWQHITCDDNT